MVKPIHRLCASDTKMMILGFISTHYDEEIIFELNWTVLKMK